jgi:AcrR family transcriptional regulator
MNPQPRKVKRPRSYDASGRRARAQDQREAVLDVASRLFVERGYVATTVESIAQETAVSEATIYKSYGGKAGLVRLLCDRALAGAGPRPAEERSNALRASTDPRQIVEGWAALTAEISPRASPLLLLLRTAAYHDEDAAALHEELDRARLTRMAENARHLFDAGHLRDDVAVRDARDVLWLCSSPELYELMVLRRRWPLTKFSRFIAATMTAALL